LGSACALGINIIYHKRQLARKTGQKYSSVPSAAAGDVEMGPEPIVAAEEVQESGVVEGDVQDGKAKANRID
jgi:hypothetical protein